jgi:hypothetical protein
MMPQPGHQHSDTNSREDNGQCQQADSASSHAFVIDLGWARLDNAAGCSGTVARGRQTGRPHAGTACLTGRVRIERENGDPVGSVWAVFTPEEARDLYETLFYAFEEGRPPEPGWHTHIGTRPDCELTIEIEDPNAPPPATSR